MSSPTESYDFSAVVDVLPVDAVPQCAWGTVKRTYRIEAGRLVPTDPSPLSHDVRKEDAEPRWPPGSDFWPHKPASDVVVIGKAFGSRGGPVIERLVKLQVGNVHKRVQVFGTRTLEWTKEGRPRIGAPEPLAEVDLTYTNAYGGIDPRVPVPKPGSMKDVLRLTGDHPGIYPRNQSGKGYVVVEAPVSGVELPNLEDPDHRLTADNVIVGEPRLWHRQPLSWFLDWHFPAMFPRATWVGATPWFAIPDSEVLEEVRRGFAPEAWRTLGVKPTDGRPPPGAFYQEASLGMSFSDLSEGTPFEVVGMHPEHDRMGFALPAFPRLAFDVEGDAQPVEAKVLHVVITPHEEKVEITWVGIRENMPRAFFPKIHGNIPITLFVDGAPVHHESPEPTYAKIKRAEEEGLIPARAARRRPGAPGQLAVLGGLLPEGRADRTRDQIALADAPTHGNIDASTGRVLLVETDWELPTHVPFAFRRFYSSSMAWRAGTLGLGWSHCLEQAIWLQQGWVLYRMEDGREVGIPLPGGELGLGASVHHSNAGVTIHRNASDAYVARLDDGRRFGFTQIDESVTVGETKARLSEIWGPDGASLSIRYDVHGRLDRMMVPGGNYVRFEHDERGRLTRVFAPTTDGSDKTVAVAFTVDASGQLREAMDAMGRKTSYRYEGRALVERILPSGDRRRFVYAGLGASARCSAERFGEDERDREVLWGSEDRVAGIVSANGSSFSIAVDEQYRVVRVLDHFAKETSRVLDEASGLPTAMTTADGETSFLYDASYHLADVSGPDAGSVQLEHDAEGRLLTRRDADGHTAHHHWDNLGRLTAVADRTGASVVYGYDGEGPLSSMLTPGEIRVEVERDVTKKAVVALHSPSGTRRAERDSIGRIVSVMDELGSSARFAYDPSGHLKEHARADVRVSYESDPQGRVTSFHDGARAIALERDELGALSHVDEGGGEGMRLHRDAEGRVTMVESEAFDFWELHRDAAGRVIEERGFVGDLVYVLRDHAGRIRRSSQGPRRTIVKRDGAGRPVELEHGDETFQRYRWTPGGRLAKAQDADRVVSFEHDGEGRITKESAGSREVRSHHDANGRRVSIDTSLGLAVRIARDATGEATRLIATLGDRRIEIGFERDLCGREVKRLLPGDLELRWRRDELGRATRREVHAGGRELSSVEHGIAGLDRQLGVRESGGTSRTHVHDARGRLVKVGVLVRALDSLGRSFRTPERDDHVYEGVTLTEAYGNRYAHDGAGQRTSRANVMDETTRYVWDGRGRLVTVSLGDEARVSYDYDGLGRLVRRRRETRMEIPGVAEAVWEATSETELVWDGLAILHEIEGTRVTTWLREEGQLVAKLSTDGAWAVLTDPLGFVTELTDTSGQLAWRGSIDAFGTLGLDAAQTDCPWRLPGHWEDPDTGLAHSWLRVWDPETNAYLSPNPFGVVSGSNPYAYLPDPLSQTSPLGLGAGYATLGGELAAERLDAELVHRIVRALDRGDGAAGPRERFERSAAAWRAPDPRDALWGRWAPHHPAHRMPGSSARYTRLPQHLGLGADEHFVEEGSDGC